MTRQQAKDLLPVITAFAEGKDVQFQSGDEKWITVDPVNNGLFNEWTNYRIKPEPREFWIMGDYRFLTHEEAVKARRNVNSDIIHVREVISEEE